MKSTRGIEPRRQDIEVLIRASCLPEAYGKSSWSKVNFPLDIAMRQCQAQSNFDYMARHLSREPLLRPGTTPEAFGLFGLTDKDAEELRVKHDDWRQNIYGGIKKDKMLFERYNGDIAKVVVAFVWGRDQVDAAVIYGPAGDRWKLMVPSEIVEYVKPILRPPA